MFLALLTSLSLFIPFISSLPNLPLTASGRHLLTASGQKVVYAGTNWPGHMSAMIPEGLQYQSIEFIVRKIKSLGMNSIRFTFAIEMVDDILDRGGDVGLRASLVKALGQGNGSGIFERIVKNNPELGKAGVTRLQVFDTVAAECEKQGIMIHLDNHISKAKWCCDTGDGNSWFGDRDFDTVKWKRAWRFMANHTKSWPALASMGMRNELRSPDNNPQLKSTSYNWPTWYEHMKACADGIFAANPAVVVFFSGLGFDTDLSAISTGRDLGNGKRFRKSDFPAGKIALELHNYQNSVKDCNAITSGLWRSGWNALNESSGIANVLPVVMTEFGFHQDMQNARGVQPQCLKDFFVKQKAGWMYWVLAGSYYTRQGGQDKDESWGMLKHDWSDWRSTEVAQTYFKPMVDGSTIVR